MPVMNFDEVVAAVQARLGQQVRVSFEEQGRTRRTCRGVLKLGRDGDTTADPEEDRVVVFQVAPSAHWFRLVPDLVTDAREQSNHWLRVEMGRSAFVIETLTPGGLSWPVSECTRQSGAR
jgi:hypothetical protein